MGCRRAYAVSFILSDRRRLDLAARRRTEEAFRPGTKANQNSHVAFSLFFQERDFPATGGHLLRFAEFLMRSLRSHKSATNALSSLRTFHLQHGFSVEAFLDYRLALWKRALPATVRHVPTPARPMPVELLNTLCSLAAGLGERGAVFSALLALAFASLARLSSLVPLGAHASGQRGPLLPSGWGQDPPRTFAVQEH